MLRLLQTLFVPVSFRRHKVDLEPVIINLDELPEDQELPRPQRGCNAFVESLLPGLCWGSLFFGLVYFSLKGQEIEPDPIYFGFATAAVFITGLLLNSLLGYAGKRYDDDGTAVGVVNTGFRDLANSIAMAERRRFRLGWQPQVTLTCWAWATYYQWDQQPYTMLAREEPVAGRAHPILAVVRWGVITSEYSAELTRDLLDTLSAMSLALGSIDRRRQNPIHTSRYLSAVIFGVLASGFISLAALIAHIPWGLAMVAVTMISTGLTTVLVNVRHLEGALGHDPGDYNPLASLKSWLTEIEGAFEQPLEEKPPARKD